MTRASMELITGAPRLFGLRPAGKQLPSPAKCPDRGVGKNLTLAKWSRACLPQKSEHEPRKGRQPSLLRVILHQVLHDSNTCQGTPILRHDLLGKISWDTFRSLFIEFQNLFLNLWSNSSEFKALTLIESWSSLWCFLLSCFWSWPWSYFPHRALRELRPCWEAKKGERQLMPFWSNQTWLTERLMCGCEIRKGTTLLDHHQLDDKSNCGKWEMRVTRPFLASTPPSQKTHPPISNLPKSSLSPLTIILLRNCTISRVDIFDCQQGGPACWGLFGVSSPMCCSYGIVADMEGAIFFVYRLILFNIVSSTMCCSS